jgi:acetyl-CoA C-acetyltransferase
MTDVFIISAVRTAIGAFGGALADVPPAELGIVVAKEAIARSAAPVSQIDNVTFAQVIPTEPADAYLARVVGINAGVPEEAPAMMVNRLCGSGLQAIISAAQSLKLRESDLALAGGVESMSRAPYTMPKARFGTRMGDVAMIDYMVGVLTDPFHLYHMGMTAENVADRYKISRAEQDDIAYESHRRASAAIRTGRFKEQIVPVVRTVRGKEVVFDADEHVRMDAKREEFDSLRPAFRRDGGTVTAGNSSGINDGAAALVLAGEAAVKTHGLVPLARLVAYAHAGVDPAYMGIGPVPATILALKRANLTISNISVIEANEAFAAQACAVAKDLKFDPELVNPNGSGISLGHPIGATGAILMTKAVAELRRTGGRYALVTMCIGGGQGIAAILERI